MKWFEEYCVMVLMQLEWLMWLTEVWFEMESRMFGDIDLLGFDDWIYPCCLLMYPNDVVIGFLLGTK